MEELARLLRVENSSLSERSTPLETGASMFLHRMQWSRCIDICGEGNGQPSSRVSDWRLSTSGENYSYRVGLMEYQSFSRIAVGMVGYIERMVTVRPRAEQSLSPRAVWVMIRGFENIKEMRKLLSRRSDYTPAISCGDRWMCLSWTISLTLSHDHR